MIQKPNLPRSRHENRRAFEASGAKIGERLIRLVEWITRGFCDNAHFWHQAQKINSILPSEVRNGHELSLLPK